jgi:hypothetical protein
VHRRYVARDFRRGKEQAKFEFEIEAADWVEVVN